MRLHHAIYNPGSVSINGITIGGSCINQTISVGAEVIAFSYIITIAINPLPAISGIGAVVILIAKTNRILFLFIFKD